MKKFITIALAVAVLFSFAACQNETPTGAVVAISATQNTTYVVGEKATVDGFTFTGRTNLGTTVSVPASDVEIVSGSVLDIDKEENEYYFNYLGYPGVKTSVKVEAEEITELTVDYSKLPVYYAAPGLDNRTQLNTVTRKIDPKLLVATAKYEGGEKTVTLDSTHLANPDWTVGKDKTLTVTFGGESDTIKYTVEPNYVKSVSLEVAGDYTTAYYAESDTANDAQIAYATYTSTTKTWTKGLYVLLTFQGGEEVIAKNDTAELSYVVDGTVVASKKLEAVLTDLANIGSSVSISAEYLGKDGIVNLDRTTNSETVKIDEIALDPDTITVTVTNNEIAKDNYTSKAPAGVSFSAKGTDGKDYTLDTINYQTSATSYTDNYYTISPADLSGTKYEKGNRYEFTFSGVIESETFTETVILLVK